MCLLLIEARLWGLTAYFTSRFFHFNLNFIQKLIFGENGEIFNLWKNPPVDIYIKIYLWNITNSEAFLSGNEKMKLEEVGPYVYRFVNFISLKIIYLLCYLLCIINEPNTLISNIKSITSTETFILQFIERYYLTVMSYLMITEQFHLFRSIP